MQVTRIYLCIHKRQILSKISVGIERIDIADMAREAQEDSDKLEHQLLFDNVTKVHNLDRSVRACRRSVLRAITCSGSDMHVFARPT